MVWLKPFCEYSHPVPTLPSAKNTDKEMAQQKKKEKSARDVKQSPQHEASTLSGVSGARLTASSPLRSSPCSSPSPHPSWSHTLHCLGLSKSLSSFRTSIFSRKASLTLTSLHPTLEVLRCTIQPHAALHLFHFCSFCLPMQTKHS